MEIVQTKTQQQIINYTWHMKRNLQEKINPTEEELRMLELFVDPVNASDMPEEQ